MTKYDPDILCPGCRDFDYAMNRQGGVSHDVFVVCECDWKPPIILDDEKKWENDQKIERLNNNTKP